MAAGGPQIKQQDLADRAVAVADTFTHTRAVLAFLGKDMQAVQESGKVLDKLVVVVAAEQPDQDNPAQAIRVEPVVRV